MTRKNNVSFMLKLALVLLLLLAASTFPLGTMAAVSPADRPTTEAKTERPGILVGPGFTGPVMWDSTWQGHYWSEPGFALKRRTRVHKEEYVPPNVARVSLDVEPLKAELVIDGTPIRASQERNRAVWLEPGSHLVEIRHPGYRTLTLSLQVAGGRSYGVYRRLQREVGTAS